MNKNNDIQIKKHRDKLKNEKKNSNRVNKCHIGLVVTTNSQHGTSLKTKNTPWTMVTDMYKKYSITKMTPPPIPALPVNRLKKE